MWTLGIDVAKKKHYATLLDHQGELVFTNLAFTNDDAGLEKLLRRISASGKRPEEITIGMEATGHYWILLFQHLTEQGFEVLLLNPMVTHARQNMTIRGSKTDPIDSRLIARILQEPEVKTSAIPDNEVAELRSLTRLRFELMQEAVALKQKLLALLDLVFPEYKDCFSDVFGETSRQLLGQFPSAAAIAKADIRRLTNLMSKASRGRLGRPQAESLKRAAKQSFALKQSNRNLVFQIRILLEELNLNLQHIGELDQETAAYLKEQQDLLKSLPGIGPVWAPAILAEVLPFLNPERKNGGRALVAAAGLDPKLNDSGGKNGKAKMSKRGSKYLRTALLEAAEVAVNISKDPLFLPIFEKQKAKNKPHWVALSHVANKMCHVIFAVLRDQIPYQPHLLK